MYFNIKKSFKSISNENMKDCTFALYSAWLYITTVITTRQSLQNHKEFSLAFIKLNVLSLLAFMEYRKDCSLDSNLTYRKFEIYRQSFVVYLIIQSTAMQFYSNPFLFHNILKVQIVFSVSVLTIKQNNGVIKIHSDLCACFLWVKCKNFMMLPWTLKYHSNGEKSKETNNGGFFFTEVFNSSFCSVIFVEVKSVKLLQALYHYNLHWELLVYS